jgi:transglutaminase-like putative cysteine protease
MQLRSLSLQQSIHHYFELSLFAMVVVGFVALAGTGRLHALAMILVVIALGLRSYLFVSHRTWNLSAKATSQITLLYVAFYVADLFLLSRSFITSVVHLVLFIMVIKVFSIHRERDYVYLAAISFMMVLAAAVLTVDSFFLGTFLIFILLAVCTFISMEMRRSISDVRKRTAEAATGVDGDRTGRQAATIGTVDSHTFSSRRLGRSLSITAALLVLSILAGVPVIFYAIPRWSFGRLTQFSAQNVFVSGFSDTVQLGEIGRIQQSDSVVMRVQFQDGSGAVPADVKWAGVTLSNFDGLRWFNDRALAESQALSAGADYRLELNAPRPIASFAGTSGLLRPRVNDLLLYRVMMEPIGTNTFFMIRTPIVLVGETRQYSMDKAGAIGYMDPVRQIRAYQGISFRRPIDPAARKATGDDFPPAIAEPYLQLPPIDPRIASLAREITAHADSAYTKATSIEHYLRTNFGYTLQMESAGTDPIAHFLFVRKRGHCEYFASAMAIMLRTLGIPSRIVNGFRNGELNDVSGSYVVRARDAHSWVEVFIPGHGWAEFDPTPAAPSEQRTSWSRILLYIDAMREFWNEWVINYDSSRQAALGDSTLSRVRMSIDRMRLFVREQYEALLERIRRTQSQVERTPIRTVTLLAAALGLTLIVIYFRKFWTWLRKFHVARRPSAQPSQAAAVWYERMLKLLQRRGMAKLPGQTAQEFVRSLPPEATRLRAKAELFTDCYERARFGESPVDADELPRRYEELEDALKR